jgi:hypothetical protein
MPAPYTLTITNPGADVDVSGWTNVAGTLTRRTSSPSPQSGAGYFQAGASAATECYQDVAVPVDAQSDVDAGSLKAVLGAWHAGYTDADTGRLRLSFRNAGGDVLHTADSANWDGTATWTERSLESYVPPLTRTIRVTLIGTRASGTNLDAYWDDLTLALATFTAAPSAPTLAFSSRTGTTVTVALAGVIDATSYELHRGGASDFTPVVGTLVEDWLAASLPATYEDTTVPQATRVWYKLVAVNANGSTASTADFALVDSSAIGTTADLALWFAANAIGYADEAPMDAWLNDGSLRGQVTGSGAARPTYLEDGGLDLGGQPVVSAGGTHLFSGGTLGGFAGNAGLTIFAVVNKAINDNSDCEIIGRWATDNHGWQLAITSTGYIQFKLVRTTGATQVIRTSSAAVDLRGFPAVIRCRYNGATGELSIWVSGRNVDGTLSDAVPATIPLNGPTLELLTALTGQVGDVQVYSRALTDEECEAIEAVYVPRHYLYLFEPEAQSPDTGATQGVAASATHFFTSSNGSIKKWGLDWSFVAENPTPNAGIANVNHLGDLEHYNGTLYGVTQFWDTCENNGYQHIVTFAASDLSRLSATDISAQAHEGAAIAVDPDRGILWIGEYCSGEIHKYDLATFAYIGQLTLSASCPYIQGITYADGYLWAACGRVLAPGAAGYVGSITRVDPDTGAVRRIFRDRPEYPQGCDFTQGGIFRRLEHDGTVTAYTVTGGGDTTPAVPTAGTISATGGLNKITIHQVSAPVGATSRALYVATSGGDLPASGPGAAATLLDEADLATEDYDHTVTGYGLTRYYREYYTNEVGTTASNLVNATTTDPRPGVPSVALDDDSPFQFTATITPGTAATDHQIFVDQVRTALGGPATLWDDALGAAPAPVVVTGRTPELVYWVMVRAINAYGYTDSVAVAIEMPEDLDPVLAVTGVTDTGGALNLLNVESEEAGETWYQTAARADSGYTVLLDESIVTADTEDESRFLVWADVGTPEAEVRSRAAWRPTSSDPWGEWIEVLWKTAPEPVDPEDQPPLSRWVSPHYGQIVTGNFCPRFAREVGRTLVHFRISDDGGETWTTLSVAVTSGGLSTLGDVEYLDFCFDSTAYADGNDYSLLAVLDDGTEIQHFGFRIGNDIETEGPTYVATSGLAASYKWAKYWHPEQFLAKYTMTAPGGKHKCQADGCPSLPMCGYAPPSLVGHAGGTQGGDHLHPPSFGPIEPAWLATTTEMDVTALWYYAVNGAGFQWAQMWGGELVTLGICLGARADDDSKGIRAQIRTGFNSPVYSGRMSCEVLDVGFIGVNIGYASVKVGGQQWTQQVRTSTSMMRLEWLRHCMRANEERVCCGTVLCGVKRGVPMRLRVWRPDAENFPRRWSFIFEVIGQAERSHIVGGGRGIIFPDQGNRPDEFARVSISDTVDLDYDMDCGALTFYTERGSASMGSTSGRFLHSFSAVAKLEECVEVPPEPAPDCAVEVDCYDALLSVSFTGGPLDAVRYRITTPEGAEVYDSGWGDPAYPGEEEEEFGSEIAFHLQQGMSPGDYVALISIQSGEDEYFCDPIPFTIEYHPPVAIEITSPAGNRSEWDGVIRWTAANALTYTVEYSTRFGVWTTLAEGVTDTHYALTPAQRRLMIGRSIQFRVCAIGECEVVCDTVELPGPCYLYATVYDDDGITPLWEVSTDPTEETQYLCEPLNYGEQEIDVIDGAASLGQLELLVVDKAQVVGDQDSGWMTQRIPDVHGHRVRVIRYVEELAGWVVLVDGPAARPELDQSYSGYRWVVKDTRETERKLRAFNASATTSLWPAGVIGGFGPVAATEPVDGIWHPYFESGSYMGWGAIHFWHHWSGPLANPASYCDAEVVIKPNAEKYLESTKGITHWEYPNVELLWRLKDSTDPYHVVVPVRSVGEETVGEGASEYSWPLAEVIDTKLADNSPVRAVPFIFHIDLGQDPPLEDGTEIEVILRYKGDPSEITPYHLEGITTGQLLKNGYDGLYSDPDPVTGLPVPSGIRYNAAALLQMTDLVRLRLTEPVTDFRAWAEAVIYAPSGWVPALDNDGAISPVSQVPPEDFIAQATLLNEAVVAPSPDWNAGELIINIVRFNYQRLYIPEGDVDALDGIAVREVVREYRHDASIRRYKDQIKEYNGIAFSALGDSRGSAVGLEDANTHAENRRYYILDRYAEGAPAIRVPVMRSACALLRPGSWVIPSLSWFPDYATRRRGMLMGGQVMAIGDLNCKWRDLLIEEVVPLEVES